MRSLREQYGGEPKQLFLKNIKSCVHKLTEIDVVYPLYAHTVSPYNVLVTNTKNNQTASQNKEQHCYANLIKSYL